MKYLPTTHYYKGHWYLRIDTLRRNINSCRIAIKFSLKDKDKYSLAIHREELNDLRYALIEAEYMLKVSK